MKDDIELIIEKNLPAHLSKVLRKKLEEAEANEECIVDLNTRIDNQAELIKKLTDQKNGLEKRAARERDLDKKESDLKDLERSLRIKELEDKLKVAEDKSQFCRDIALGMVRNIEYRRSLFGNVSEPYTDSNGYQQYANRTQNSEETNKAE